MSPCPGGWPPACRAWTARTPIIPRRSGCSSTADRVTGGGPGRAALRPTPTSSPAMPSQGVDPRRAGARPTGSEALGEVFAAGWRLVGRRPEVVDPADQPVVEVEEAQAGLLRVVDQEPGPAHALPRAGADDAPRFDRPVARIFRVELHIGLPAADPLPGLRQLVDHIRSEQRAEGGPVAGVGRGPVCRDHLCGSVAHTATVPARCDRNGYRVSSARRPRR